MCLGRLKLNCSFDSRGYSVWYRSLRYCWYSLRQSGSCGVGVDWVESAKVRRKNEEKREKEGGGREGGTTNKLK